MNTTYHQRGKLIQGCAPEDHPLYSVWANMKRRCMSPNSSSYQHYGGRGIKVCDRWMHFENFVLDMSPRPEGLTLERIDVNGDYTPDNCTWATYSEQCLNRRTFRNNTSGQTGVEQRRDGVWMARYMSVFIGYYDTKDEAVAARLAYAETQDPTLISKSRPKSNSTTGVRGINLLPGGKYKVRSTGANRVLVGLYDTLDEAKVALEAYMASRDQSLLSKNRARSNSRSGVRGVTVKGDRYIVRSFDKPRVYLGSFDSLEQAVQVLRSHHDQG